MPFISACTQTDEKWKGFTYWENLDLINFGDMKMIDLNIVNFITIGVIAMLFAWLYTYVMGKFGG